MDDTEMDRRLVEWTATRSVVDRGDPVWELISYRFARYAMDLAREDVASLGDARHDVGDQLLRAAGSVSANIAEGYSRPTVADRTRFYSYALGSVREAATWYAALEGAELTPDTVAERIAVLARIRRLLFGMITAAKKRKGGSVFER
jgi:four helix bundle protein